MKYVHLLKDNDLCPTSQQPTQANSKRNSLYTFFFFLTSSSSMLFCFAHLHQQSLFFENSLAFYNFNLNFFFFVFSTFKHYSVKINAHLGLNSQDIQVILRTPIATPKLYKAICIFFLLQLLLKMYVLVYT